MSKRWTEGEIKYLRNNYEDMTNSELADELDNRTESAVRHKTQRLGLTRRQPLPDVCIIEDCNGDPLARGWCGKHYQRWHKYGDPQKVKDPTEYTNDVASLKYADSKRAKTLTGKEKSHTATSDVNVQKWHISWLAAILEGEGSIEHHGSGDLEITVTQKKKWLIDRLIERFGGGYRMAGRNKQYYNWRVTGARARGIGMTVYKFLSPHKKENIQEACLEAKKRREGIDRMIDFYEKHNPDATQ